MQTEGKALAGPGASGIQKAGGRSAGQKVVRELRKHWVRYLMMVPGTLCLVIFSYIPMVGIVMAFQKLDLRKGVFTSPFVGLANFKFLFASTDAWIITRNTVGYNVVFILLDLVLSVFLALILSELKWKRCSKVLQTVYIMPYFLSMVVVSTVLYSFLSPTNGLLNTLLGLTGPNKIDWYQKTEYWPFILTGVHLWKNVGYSSVIYMAAISGISGEYYEAAVLDGASKMQQARYITLPHLRPVICIKLIMAIGQIFRADFGLFYTVPRDSGRLYPVTQVLDTYVYRAMTNLNNPGMAAAAGFYQSVVGFVLVLAANKIVSKIDADSAMF